MNSNLKHIFSSGSKYYLLGISINEGESQYQLITVFYKDEELKIEERHFFNAFNDLKINLNKEYPVILYIEGEAVINKQVENQTGYRSNLLFKANLEAFYFYEFFQDNTVFVSISRKEHIEDLVTQIKTIGRTVIHVSFGPFVLANLLPFLEPYNTISTFNYTLKTSNLTIKSFDKENEQSSYSIEGDTVNQRELPLLASFFDYKFPKEAISFDNEFVSQNKEDYKFKTWLMPLVTSSVLFLLIALVFSHFLLDSYLEKLAEKQSSFIFSTQNVEALEGLKKDQRLKESILESSAIFNKEFIVKYIADVGNSTPQDITLTRIEFLPTLKKVRPNEKVGFVLKTIELEGETNNDATFNNWVITLQKMKWINKVEIIAYTQDGKRINNFKLNIRF